MPRILITGGAGFIGQAVIRTFRQVYPESSLRAMDLVKAPGDDIERYTGSILDANDINRAVQDCDYVVHLAAMLGVKRTEAQRLECLTVNIQGTLNVLDACVKNRVKKIVFSSSSEIYGEPFENPIREVTPASPKSVYAVTKLAGEEYLRAYRERYGLRFSVVRFFNVYGPGQVAEFVMPRFIKAVMEDKPPVVYGAGNQIRAFCYVDDAAAGVVRALLNDKADGEAFNIGNDLEPVSMRELAGRVITLLGKPMKPVLVEMSQSDRSAGREIHERFPDISKARRVLAYEPTVSLDEGVRRTAAAGPIEASWYDPMT
ncbi:MAG: NAD-dependent epimerase/dehydratase family protein [Kiritimatiellae bacterium]|nr:NAD-dependent epimerase/dehydratase family protein [Kiritimatiellia bacterium]